MNIQAKFYVNNLHDSRINFEKFGFVIYKNLLKKNFLEDYKKNIIVHLKKFGNRQGTALTQPNAAVLMPFLKDFFSHEGIIEKLKFFISDEIVFTCHADAHMGILNGWHKDDGTEGGKSKGYFGEWTYGNSDCQIYRVAIYFQDHSKDSAGLSVIPGSHKISPKEFQGEPVTLNTNAGDVIIFDPRLTHSGQKDVIPLNWNKKNYWIKKLLDFIRKMPLLGKVVYSLIKIIHNKIFGSKTALFFTYGAKNKWTSKFSIENMKRQIARTNIYKTKLPKETYNQINNRGVEVFEDFGDVLSQF